MQAALRRCRKGFVGVTLFSAFANILMLVAPVYMLQMYDRVLTSASYETLIVLTVVAVFLLSCFGLLDWVRQRLMARIALSLNYEVLDDVLSGVFRGSLQRFRQSANQPVRDLDTVRQFLSSPPVLAFFEPLGAGVHRRHFHHPSLAGFLCDIRRAADPVHCPADGVDVTGTVAQRLGTPRNPTASSRAACAMRTCWRRWACSRASAAAGATSTTAASRSRPGAVPASACCWPRPSRAPDRAGGHPRHGRLAGAQTADHAGHDDRCLHYPRARPGAHRTGDFRVARVHVRPQSWRRLNNLLTSAPPAHGGGATSLPRPTGLLTWKGYPQRRPELRN